MDATIHAPDGHVLSNTHQTVNSAFDTTMGKTTGADRIRRIMKKYLSVMIVLIVGIHVADVGAKVPAHSPNYCGSVVCTELDPAFRHVVKTDSVVDVDGVTTDMKVSGPEGSLTLHVQKSSLPCRREKSLILRKADSTYSGRLVTKAPDEEACWEVRAEYLPSTTTEVMRPASPVTYLWLVDDVTSSFWSEGYALRIGSGIEVSIESAP